MLMKKHDMQYRICKLEYHHSSGQNRPISMLATCNTSLVPTQPFPHPTNSSSSYFGPASINLWAARYCLSYKEHQKRIDEGYCLYCSSFNHIVCDCPNKPKVSDYPLHSTAAKVATQPKTSMSSPTCQLGNV
jgi:hypothetical protein